MKVSINQSLFCYWACGNLTSRSTALTAIDAITTEFDRGGFIQDIFRKIWSVVITITPDDVTKRQTSPSQTFAITPCRPNEVIEMRQLLEDLSREIAPRAPSLEVTMDETTCVGTISSTDPPQGATPAETPIIPIVIGVVASVVALILLGLGIALYYHLYDNDLKYLPEEIAWSYRQYKLNPLSWNFRGTSNSGTISHPPPRTSASAHLLILNLLDLLLVRPQKPPNLLLQGIITRYWINHLNFIPRQYDYFLNLKIQNIQCKSITLLQSIILYFFEISLDVTEFQLIEVQKKNFQQNVGNVKEIQQHQQENSLMIHIMNFVQDIHGTKTLTQWQKSFPPSMEQVDPPSNPTNDPSLVTPVFRFVDC